MTVRRSGIGYLDDARTCVACPALAPATPAQVEWPGRVARLRREAEALEARAKALRAEANTLVSQIKVTPSPAFLCGGCRTHLHDPALALAWAGGRHDAADVELIARTVEYVHAPEHQPSPTKGSCLDCQGRQAQPEPA